VGGGYRRGGAAWVWSWGGGGRVRGERWVGGFRGAEGGGGARWCCPLWGEPKSILGGVGGLCSAGCTWVGGWACFGGGLGAGVGWAGGVCGRRVGAVGGGGKGGGGGLGENKKINKDN